VLAVTKIYLDNFASPVYFISSNWDLSRSDSSFSLAICFSFCAFISSSCLRVSPWFSKRLTTSYTREHMHVHVLFM